MHPLYAYNQLFAVLGANIVIRRDGYTIDWTDFCCRNCSCSGDTNSSYVFPNKVGTVLFIPVIDATCGGRSVTNCGGNSATFMIAVG